MTTLDEAMDQVTDALGALSSALATGRADAVMAAEAPVAAATAAFAAAARAARARPALDQIAVARRLTAVRALVDRCRLLGIVPVRLSSAMFAGTSTYGPTGAMSAHRPALSFNSRY
jgi:hypothetical protein